MTARQQYQIKALYDRIRVVARAKGYSGKYSRWDWHVQGTSKYFVDQHTASQYREWLLKREVDRIKRVRWSKTKSVRI